MVFEHIGIMPITSSIAFLPELRVNVAERQHLGRDWRLPNALQVTPDTIRDNDVNDSLQVLRIHVDEFVVE